MKDKEKILKRWLRKLIAGGCYEKAPSCVVTHLLNMGVPIQVEGERHGVEWDWMTLLEDMFSGEKVDGVMRAKAALAQLEDATL